jgi:hypothetical protein
MSSDKNRSGAVDNDGTVRENPNTQTVISPDLRLAIQSQKPGARPDRILPEELFVALKAKILTEQRENGHDYHNDMHALTVMRRVARLCDSLQDPVTDAERQLLQIAALMHDYGHAGRLERNLAEHAERPDLSNEEYSALKADEFFGRHLSLDQRLRLQGLILATSYYFATKNAAARAPVYLAYTNSEKVLALADLGTFEEGVDRWVEDSFKVLSETPFERRPSSMSLFFDQLDAVTGEIEKRIAAVGPLLKAGILSEMQGRVTRARGELKLMRQGSTSSRLTAAAGLWLNASDSSQAEDRDMNSENADKPEDFNQDDESLDSEEADIFEEDGAEPAQAREPYSCMVMLQRMFLFKSLSVNELQKIREISYILDCPANRTLIQEGSSNNLLYIILSGEVAIYRNQRLVKTLARGNHFGEMALLNSMPRTATVVSTKESSLLVIERERFVGLINEDPEVGLKAIWEMAKQLSIRLDDLMEKSFNEE